MTRAMLLSDLLPDVEGIPAGLAITGLVQDSRAIRPGDAFVAIGGFGAHGLGFIALCIVIWIACVRREAPYTLLAATLTPVGPVGSVIGIELIERRGWGVADSPQKVA